jgi:RHS repeat-associated protein
MQYDSRGFLSRIDYPGGRWFTFEYNDAGQRTRRTGHDGYILNYYYDAAGRLQRLADGTGAEIVSYSYDSVGRLSREDKGNGTYTTYAYDAAGHLRSMVNYSPSGTVQSHFDYTYDANGNRVTMMTPTGTTTHDYDANGQLTGVTYPGGRRVTYAYDAVGNRVAVTDNGKPTAYTTNSLNQYMQVGGATYTYDTDGNMISKTDASGTSTYGYDSENRLITVTTPLSGTWQYTYDALGNRITVTRDGVVARYVHDPVGLVDVAAEYDAGGALIARYVHGVGLVARINATGDSAYYAFDGTGHTRQMTNAAGAIANTYDYDPFGIPLQTSETISNPFRYVGRFGVMEEATDLVFMRGRYFESNTGRFTTEDLLLSQDGNQYTYAINSPLVYFDPVGWEPTRHYTDFEAKFSIDYLLKYAERFGRARALSHLNPTWGDPWTLRNLEVHSHFGLVDIDWFLTLAAFGNRTGIRPLVSYLPGKIKWAIEDRGDNHWRTIGNPAEIRAIVMAELVHAGLPIRTVFIIAGVTSIIAPRDPNEKVGPPGIGSERVIGVDDELQFTIYFENVITATAPAQQVFIIDNLDPDLDWTTFHPTEIAFGNTSMAITEQAGGFYARTSVPDYRDGVNETWWVDITVQPDYRTGIVTWILRTLDPLTGKPPTDPLAGFLPPNNPNDHRGEGHVSFGIKPRSNSTWGTAITNSASIIFDTEASITTNVVMNTIGGVNLVYLPVILRNR